ncbi:RsmB/NOP family class I SAM-dependent RNA methyltransferase [Roseicyclus elongatus]|uniref:RsmB/NOP family class I SAM-dependent RNA methyltransferase n=1 Tax=Roseicyclus elongatus TaxID=159346 RepID=UPI000571CF28|nr:RsmB/NOP family class I SAM-dependent RNA methyltransferase [Roseibacterium elongatum]
MARQAALSILDQVLRRKRMLAHLPQDPGLTPPEAARATRLSLMVLRHLEPLDAVIARFVERKPQPAVNALLRLGTAELLIAGEEPHGVVNAMVALARTGRRTERGAGLVNAVLRRVSEGGDALWQGHTPQRLPGWIGGPIKKRWGTEVLRAIEAAHERGAAIDITGKAPDVDIPNAKRLPTGSLRLNATGQVSALPGFSAGAWWVQDAAAALPARLLGDVAGQTVLDMCAAPGGKTLQLAAAGAQVTALDLSDTRLDRLRQNLVRTGLSAEIVVSDALDHHGGPYEAILLDAPCTASGTLRRHPDLPFVKSWTEVEPLTRLQMRLLDHALRLLAPGGKLVYCTCSLLPVEGEHQVGAALKRHDDLSIVPLDPQTLGGAPDWASPEGGLRLRPDLWPEHGGLDGFYMACLTRDASTA